MYTSLRVLTHTLFQLDVQLVSQIHIANDSRRYCESLGRRVVAEWCSHVWASEAFFQRGFSGSLCMVNVESVFKYYK